MVGAFLSTEVAKTISGGIVNDALVTPTMIFAGLVAAILWNPTTWLFGLPSSHPTPQPGQCSGFPVVRFPGPSQVVEFRPTPPRSARYPSTESSRTERVPRSSRALCGPAAPVA